jgi:hypothetical protein
MKREQYEPRLFPDLVREIRRWHAEYSAIPKPRDICRQYNISRNRLWAIVSYSSYKDVR